MMLASANLQPDPVALQPLMNWIQVRHLIIVFRRSWQATEVFPDLRLEIALAFIEFYMVSIAIYKSRIRARKKYRGTTILHVSLVHERRSR